MTNFIYKIANGTAIYRGRVLNSVKYGTELVIGDIKTDYSNKYFTIHSLENNNEISFTKGSNAPNITFYYSSDNGLSWNSFNSSMTWALNAGSKVMLKASCSQVGANNSQYGWRFSSTNKYNVYGNIMSLMYEDSFEGKVRFPGYSASMQFGGLFNGNTNLIDASGLVMPVTLLDDLCYSFMFYHCTSLVEAPVLPASDLANQCYAFMFDGCSSLRKITCYATNRPKNGCLNYWVQGVSATGDFYKKDASWTLESIHSIPAGWTQHNI